MAKQSSKKTPTAKKLAAPKKSKVIKNANVKKGNAKKTGSKKLVSKKFGVSHKTLWLLIATLLIWAGMAAGGFDFISTWWTVRHTHGLALTNNTPVHSSTPLIKGTPTHISIPSVGIDLEVIPGYYNSSDQSWTLSLDKAQWGTMTAQANNKEGDTYIYGHYRLHVFYTLPHVQPGDEAVVMTDNGHKFTYQFVSSVTTTPTDTSLFSYKGKPILVLQTCTGLWYQYRQLFTFHLVEVDGKPANIRY